MASWDIVFPYSNEMEAWFVDQGFLPPPPVLQGNRAPTIADIKWAIAEQGNFSLAYVQPKEFGVVGQGGAGFDIRGCDYNDESSTPEQGTFAIRGTSDLQTSFLTVLCVRCGQLVVYPESGGPIEVVHTNDKRWAFN